MTKTTLDTAKPVSTVAKELSRSFSVYDEYSSAAIAQATNPAIPDNIIFLLRRRIFRYL
jgi:hypothetical protein